MPITKASGNSVTAAAKGDLVVGNATNDSGILSVGESGSTLVADSSTSTGLRWQGLNAAGRNLIVNGNLDFFQRGISGSVGGTPTYTADRWQSLTFGGGTMNWSRTTLSNSPVGSTNALRIQRPNGATNTNTMNIAYTAETADSLRFAGQNVTLSFWARAGANFSAASNALNVQVVTGTGTDQGYYSTGLTGASNIIITTVTLTTSWQKFTLTGTVGASATQLALVLYSQPTGTAGANDWFEFTQVQLESGSVATPFTRAGGTLAGELAACQRYYQTVAPAGHVAYTTVGCMGFLFPVTMRTTPTAAFSWTGVSNRVYNINTGATSDLVSPVVIVSNTSINSFYAFTPSGWAVAAGTGFNTNWTLSAEL